MGFEPMTILLQHQCTTEACSKAGQIQSTQALISKSYWNSQHKECSRHANPNNVILKQLHICYRTINLYILLSSCCL